MEKEHPHVSPRNQIHRRAHMDTYANEDFRFRDLELVHNIIQNRYNGRKTITLSYEHDIIGNIIVRLSTMRPKEGTGTKRRKVDGV